MVGGLGTVQNTAPSTTNRFAREDFDSLSAAGAGRVSRGFIRCDATPIAGGCRINVQSFHSAHDDSVTLYLLAEVLDKKTNQLRTVTLGVLANGENLNGATWRGNHNFDVSYDDVNTWLKQKNPNLSITPGHTSLAVSASWSYGHQAGGFARGGVFRLPAAQQVQSPIATRIAAATGAGSDDADLPLDMQVAFPAALLQQVPQLKKDGNIVTRLESELKGGTDKTSMIAAVDTMYRLAAQAHAGDTSEISTLLGKDWTVETVNRYWLKDDGNSEGHAGVGFFKGFRVDDNRLPIQDPMKDTYMDDGNLRMTRHEGAIRLRSNAAATVVNVKPGGGRTDEKTAITQRIEVGIEMAGGTDIVRASQALQALGTGQYADTIFNHAQKQVRSLDNTLQLPQCLVPWLDVVQDRHKFTLKNEKTGVEIELSLDFVKASTTRSNHADAQGAPRSVEFCVLEAELDHLQVGGSQNQGTFAAQSAGSGGFQTDAQQDQWLTATSDQVTMDIDPRLHELKDLDNASFRNTSSYKAFEGVTRRLVPMLFARGLEPGRQKAAAAAEMLGFICFDDAKMLATVKDTVTAGGIRWTPALQLDFETSINDPQRRRALESSMSAGTSQRVVAFTQVTNTQTPIEYDVPAVKRRVEDKLAQLGLSADLTFFDQLTPANVPPRQFDGYMSMLTTAQDSEVLSYFARAIGVASPAITLDISRLLQRSEQQHVLRTAMTTTAVDPSQKVEIEKFFVDLGARGLTSYEARQYLAALGRDPQSCVRTLAQAKQLTAPALRADAALIAARLQPGLKAHHFKSSVALDDFVTKFCAACSHADALAFVDQMARAPESTLADAAKRTGLSAPALERDWLAIDTELKAEVAPSLVAWTPALEKLVRTAIAAGVTMDSLSRAFRQLRTQPLDEALKSAFIVLAGATVPVVEADIPAVEAAVRTSNARFAPMLAQAELPQFIAALVTAGVTPSQAALFLARALANGKANAITMSAGARPLTALPAVPVDIDAFATATQHRLGATYTPHHDAFIRQHLRAAFDKDIGLQNLDTNLAHGICQLVATATGQPLPAGL